jgi:hypothetical protein
MARCKLFTLRVVQDTSTVSTAVPAPHGFTIELMYTPFRRISVMNREEV